MMTLVSENLRDEFGGIRLEVIFQDGTTRLSCIRRVADDEVLSCHVVLFAKEGIKALGPTHERIVAGEMLGEVIQDSGTPHARTISEKTNIEMIAGLSALFATDESRCTSERIEYQIRGIPYATIYEFYNPKYTPVVALASTLEQGVRALMQKYLVIKKES